MFPQDPNKMVHSLASDQVSEAFGAINNLKSRGAEAVPYLLEAIKGDNDSTRVMAVVVLSEIGHEAESAIPVLLNLLLEDNVQMLMATALALVRIGEGSIEPLKQFVRTVDKEKCFWASWSLALLHAPVEEKSIQSLNDKLKKSSNPIEILAAEEALGKIIGKQLKP